MELINQLKIYKRKHQLSYSQLGALLHISKDVAFDLLNGHRRFIDLTTLQRAQDLLNKQEA